MKRCWTLALWAGLGLHGAVAHCEESLPADAVIVELAHLSGLSEGELQTLVANCQASQQSMYFCAWRDKLVSEQGLQRALAQKKRAHPACASRFDSKVAGWKRQRDANCRQSAREQWGEGSMRPTAELLCQASDTQKMVKRFETSGDCE